MDYIIEILVLIIGGGLIVKNIVDKSGRKRYNTRQQSELELEARDLQLKIKAGIESARKKKEIYDEAKKNFINKFNPSSKSSSDDKK